MLLFGAITLALVFYAAGGWYFSSQIYERALRSQSYDSTTLQTGQIEAITGSGNGGTITIRPAPDDLADPTFDDAAVGLFSGESLVVAGPVVSSDAETQTRKIFDVRGKRPKEGQSYGLSRDVWLDPDQAGMDYDDVTVTTLEGLDFPAWSVPADNDSADWAVLIHGRGAGRSEMLRLGRVLHDDGYNLLIVTYTGDVGAPPYPDGMNQYGRTEWKEIEAAVQYVRDQGAQRVILSGASHGGAVALGFLARSAQASRIDGLILEAPASSLRDVIDAVGDNEKIPVVNVGVPESLEDVAMALVAWRYQVNFATIDYTGMQNLVKMPLLMIQGDADQTVPKVVNDEFMAGPGQGNEYFVVPGAGHVLAWNLSPDKYADQVRAFLKALDTAAAD